MSKPGVGALAFSGFNGALSANGLIAVMINTAAAVLLPMGAQALGLAPAPGTMPSGPETLVQVIIALLSLLLTMPFQIAMVEHLFQRPSPIGTVQVVARYAIGLVVMIILAGILGTIGGGLLAALWQMGPAVAIITGIPAALAILYFALGSIMIWPAAVFAPSFSPFRAFGVARGVRWRLFLALLLVAMPYIVIALSVVLVLGPGFAARLQNLSLTGKILLTLLTSFTSVCAISPVTALYLWQVERQQG